MKIYTKLHNWLAVVLLSVLIVLPTTAQNSLFNLLQSVEKLELKIITDLDKITGDRNTNEEFPATFEIYNKKDLVSSWDIKLKQRGRYRRKVCGFPPIKLDFDKDQLEDRGLADFDKFKLVTHCIDDKVIGNENVTKEHLVYELYNLISPYSYRTILTKVTYQDRDDKRRKVERYALLLEPTSELEYRINAEEMEGFVNPPIEETNAVVENQVSLFEYMIGNEDWGIPMMRNLKAFRSKEDGKYILVPYDFDFSGIINTSYAVPNSEVGLASVEERAFMGNPTTNDVFQANKNLFIAKKEALLKRLDDQKKLTASQRFYMKKYVESFYPALEALDIPILGEEVNENQFNELRPENKK
ncbi:MAG TPA: hypothetical protein VJ953_15985 [Saprospiraceae bacterium]|nr:hypothetical protein [Saprospiraceae bacterium]HKL90094.1 hypothetical protein [Allomuricauda sp.]